MSGYSKRTVEPSTNHFQGFIELYPSFYNLYFHYLIIGLFYAVMHDYKVFDGIIAYLISFCNMIFNFDQFHWLLKAFA